MQSQNVVSTLNWCGNQTSTLFLRWNDITVILASFVDTQHSFEITYSHLNFAWWTVFATTQTFMNKNNWLILKCKQKILFNTNYKEILGKNFILPFYNVNFQKSPRFFCEVIFLSTSSIFSHQSDLQNFSCPLYLSDFSYIVFCHSVSLHTASLHTP